MARDLIDAQIDFFMVDAQNLRADQVTTGSGPAHDYLQARLREILFNAIRNNNKDVIKEYLNTNVESTISSIADPETGDTLLHCAAKNSRHWISKKLVEAGANLFKMNRAGNRPDQESSGTGLTHDYLNTKTREYQELLTAITSGTNSGFWELFNALEPAVASHPVNQAGDTPLHLAAVNSRKWIANKLVQAGADIFKMNDAGKRADQLTSGSGLTHKFLNSKFKETLANAIEQNHKPTMVNYLKTDVASTISMAITAETNHTMLHLAAIHSRRAIAELLVSAGANLFKINTAGKRPDQETSGRGLTHRYLTEKTREYLALRTSVTSGTNSEFRRLFNAQNQLVIRHPVNQNGDTLLHLAAENSRFTVSEILIGAGADILQTNDRGKRAHELTSGTGYTHDYLLDLFQNRS